MEEAHLPPSTQEGRGPRRGEGGPRDSGSFLPQPSSGDSPPLPFPAARLANLFQYTARLFFSFASSSLFLASHFLDLLGGWRVTDNNCPCRGCWLSGIHERISLCSGFDPDWWPVCLTQLSLTRLARIPGSSCPSPISHCLPLAALPSSLPCSHLGDNLNHSGLLPLWVGTSSWAPRIAPPPPLTLPPLAGWDGDCPALRLTGQHAGYRVLLPQLSGWAGCSSSTMPAMHRRTDPLPLEAVTKAAASASAQGSVT